jgi:hypothetical protein
MTTRIMPLPKQEAELDNFINQAKINVDPKPYIKKSLFLDEETDYRLKLFSAKSKKTQMQIMQAAINEYLQNHS